jgi:transposase
MMQDVQDEPLFAERVAGLDIAKAEVEVTIRVPSDTTSGRRQQETRTFGTTRAELESLGDWLACWGVTKIGMEATGDYWKPVFFLLESRGFDCQLYNAAQVKALPGRPKTDPLTELPGGVPQVSGRRGALVATVADHDHTRRCAAGPVPAGDAAGRVA